MADTEAGGPGGGIPDDRVLVDSSAWIAFFRERNAPVGAVVDRLLEEERGAVVPVVRAEILQGARSSAELERLGRLFDALELLPDPPDLWQQVARLGFDLRRGGVDGVGVPDLLVAAAALAHDVPVLTLDRDFRRIGGIVPLRLVAVPD
jgi:hypothetical protein